MPPMGMGRDVAALGAFAAALVGWPPVRDARHAVSSLWPDMVWGAPTDARERWPRMPWSRDSAGELWPDMVWPLSNKPTSDADDEGSSSEDSSSVPSPPR